MRSFVNITSRLFKDAGFSRLSKDIGSLYGLGEVAEDIVDSNDGLACLCSAIGRGVFIKLEDPTSSSLSNYIGLFERTVRLVFTLRERDASAYQDPSANLYEQYLWGIFLLGNDGRDRAARRIGVVDRRHGRKLRTE
jgi:hypothetical protein